MKRKMKVLVTGGSGFLGKHVVAELSKIPSISVEILSKSAGFDLRVESDALTAVMVAKPSAIIHLAAVCGGIGANMARPGNFIRDNLQIGMNVVHAAMLAEAHLTAIGTVCSYPKDSPVPFVEADYWNGYPEPTNAPYGIAKKAVGVMLNAYRDQYGLKSCHLVPANLYGPGDHFEEKNSHVIPAMIKRFVDAKVQNLPEVTCWGSGTATRSFLHVRDAAQAIAEACVSGLDEEEIINLPGCDEISIADIAKLVALAVGYEGAVLWDQTKPDGQPRRAIDGARAFEFLEWGPVTGLAEGIKETVDWYKESLAK